MTDTFLTALELANRRKVSIATIWRWKRMGLLPFVQPAGHGGAVRFLADAAIPPDTSKLAIPAEPSEPATPAGSADKRTIRLSGKAPKWRS